jgi:hypothetical protein
MRFMLIIIKSIISNFYNFKNLINNHLWILTRINRWSQIKIKKRNKWKYNLYELKIYKFILNFRQFGHIFKNLENNNLNLLIMIKLGVIGQSWDDDQCIVDNAYLPIIEFDFWIIDIEQAKLNALSLCVHYLKCKLNVTFFIFYFLRTYVLNCGKYLYFFRFLRRKISVAVYYRFFYFQN